MRFFPYLRCICINNVHCILSHNGFHRHDVIFDHLNSHNIFLHSLSAIIPTSLLPFTFPVYQILDPLTFISLLFFKSLIFLILRLNPCQIFLLTMSCMPQNIFIFLFLNILSTFSKDLSKIPLFCWCILQTYPNVGVVIIKCSF